MSRITDAEFMLDQLDYRHSWMISSISEGVSSICRTSPSGRRNARVLDASGPHFAERKQLQKRGNLFKFPMREKTWIQSSTYIVPRKCRSFFKKKPEECRSPGSDNGPPLNARRASACVRAGTAKRNFLTSVLIPSLFIKRSGDRAQPQFPENSSRRICITWIGHASFLIQTHEVTS